MNKKHLLLLTPGFAANERDTTCIPALQLYVKELLSREQFEITILTFHYPFKAEEYQWFNAKIIALGGQNKKGIHRLINLTKAFRRVKILHKIQPINHLQSFWLNECAWLGQKIASAYSIPHCCTLMGQDALKISSHIKRLNTLPKLITLSKFHTQKLYENYKLKADLVIPWGIEGSEIQNSLSRPIDVLGVGSLIELKDFERFIEIIRKLKLDIPTIYAEIVGEGPFNGLLQKLIETYQLASNIKLIGQLDRELVLVKMAQSKCFLHCSLYESFGMVVPEALGQGAHVFSTAVGIAPEMDSVTLFETNEQVVEHINKFLKNDFIFKPETPLLIANTVDSYIKTVF